MNCVALVTGDYFVQTGQGNILRGYDVEIKLPTWEKCQNMARYHILPVLLKKADKDFMAIRTCFVQQVTNAKGKPLPGLPLEFMSVNQITDYCKTHGLKIRVEMYTDVAQLRKQVRFAKENPEKFAVVEAKKERVFDTVSAALAMNQEEFVMVGKAREAAETPSSKTVVKPKKADKPDETDDF